MDSNQPTLADQIQSKIASSSLSDDDKKLLTDNLLLLPDNILEIFLGYSKDDPEFFEAVAKNLKMKLDALDNPDKIPAIVEQEKEELRQILNQS